jgi:hypothetical protein
MPTCGRTDRPSAPGSGDTTGKKMICEIVNMGIKMVGVNITPKQGTFTEGDGSLTVDLIVCFEILTGLYKEVNCAEPSP